MEYEVIVEGEIIKKDINWYYSKEATKCTIVSLFNKIYGFAPAKKNIRFLETSGVCFENKDYFDFVAFHVNGIGYSLINGINLIKDTSYDL